MLLPAVILDACRQESGLKIMAAEDILLPNRSGAAPFSP